jgi:GNAT superfamily N-acetyltransferase
MTARAIQDDGFIIRQADTGDAAAVSRLAARTFYETFEPYSTAEDMAAYLASAYSEDLQRAELEDPNLFTLVAERDGELAAYAMIRRDGPLPSCVTLPSPVEVWRFYVDRQWHGRGLAAAMMASALDAARDLGARSVWLAVWERNARAIAFYSKYAFVDVGAKEFWVGSDRQTDRVLSRSLDHESTR